MILSCTCKHRFQDEQYGYGKRVFNKMQRKGGESQRYRCTVCGNIREFRGETKDDDQH